MSQAWLDQRERGSLLVIRFFVGFALLLGRRVARLMLYPGCLYFLVFSVKPRAASRKYLGRVLGRPAGLRDVFRHYFAFAAVALDRVYLLKDRVDLFQVTIRGEHYLREIIKKETGCLLLGAHLGSFEILRAFGTRNEIEVGLVMYEENARMVNTVAKAINPALAQNVISLGRFDSMLKVRERLEQSDWVGMLGDRALDVETKTKVPFLGEDAAFTTAPFRIALMLRRPVVLMLGIYRGGNRYDVYFEPLFDPQTVERAERERCVEDALRGYVQRLEHYCREAPYNWFNFYDFWDDASHGG